MKRLAVAVAAVTALALTGAPAIADENKGNQNKAPKAQNYSLEIGGTIRAIVDTSTVSVTVKNVSMDSKTRAIANAIIAASKVSPFFNVKTNASTVIRKGNLNTFGSLAVGDRVEIRAACTLVSSTLSCTASRINASAAPAPAPLRLNFDISGVLVSNTAGTLVTVVTRASTGDDNPLKAKALVGTSLTTLTDSTTVVTWAGHTFTNPANPVADLTAFRAVTISGTCTSAVTPVCTAKRITVIVPTT